MQHPESSGTQQRGGDNTGCMQMNRASQQRTLRVHMPSALLQLIHHTDCGGQHAAKRHPELVRLLSRRLGFVW